MMLLTITFMPQTVNMLPVFSIVIPTYNRATLIGKTLESVFAQRFQDFEVLVVDDGSKDNTKEVVNKFNDSRLTYFLKENGERGAARNYGAARARGQYVNFFDSDDIMCPNHLEVANTMISPAPEIFHLGYDTRLGDGTLLRRSNSFRGSLNKVILFDNVLSCNGVFLKKEIIDEYRFCEDRDLSSSEDWELWIRLACRFKIHYLNEITTTVIDHDYRSLRTIDPAKVVVRDLLFIERLRGDEAVMRTYGRSFSRFVAERYTFFMMRFAELRRRTEVLTWAMRASWVHPPIIVSRRFLAAIKNIVIK
jgi:glycosyltransferase involved in cell wall biosynthesis